MADKKTTSKELKQLLVEALSEPKEAKDADDLVAERQLKGEEMRQRKEPHFWIELIKMQDDNEGAVYVGAAGVGYLLPKGVRMPVPISCINALRMAHVDSRFLTMDENTGQRGVRRQQYDRYPFSEFGPASPEEVKAWRKEQERKTERREGIIEGVIAPEEEVIGRPAVEYGNTQMTSVGE